MPQLTFQGQCFSLIEQETVLDCLLRHGVAIANSCRSGICQSCLMRAVSGNPPDASQQGLKQAWREQGYFMPCSCVPEEDLDLVLPDAAHTSEYSATITSTEQLSESVMRLRLRCEGEFRYRAGQFINLRRDDGLQRSYSLASVPGLDDELELHIKKLPGGSMSGWLHDAVQAGDRVMLSGSSGDCYYSPDDPARGILMLATGSGLAPLWAIVRDALQQRHHGPIRLFHGGDYRQDLYLVRELNELAQAHANFHYHPCLRKEDVSAPGFSHASVEDHALTVQPQLSDWKVYLCGNPNMVKGAKRRAFLAGASLQHIHADPFVIQSS